MAASNPATACYRSSASRKHRTAVEQTEEEEVLTPGGDVLHVGKGVLDLPLLRAQDYAVEVGIDDRRPQTLELSDEPEEQVQNQQSGCYRESQKTL